MDGQQESKQYMYVKETIKNNQWLRHGYAIGILVYDKMVICSQVVNIEQYGSDLESLVRVVSFIAYLIA